MRSDHRSSMRSNMRPIDASESVREARPESVICAQAWASASDAPAMPTRDRLAIEVFELRSQLPQDARLALAGARSRQRQVRARDVLRPQSRMRGSHDRSYRADERFPGLALLGQYAAPRWREPVEASSPLAWLLDPAALDPAAVLQTEQRGVERGEGERVSLSAPESARRFDTCPVPVTGTSLEQ